MLLSKTNYLIYRDCQKNAWLKIHKPETYRQYPLSAFELNIIETGNEIDELARDLFPGGVLVHNDTELTKQLMDDETPVIYQPTFTTDKYITACDIFVWNKQNKKYDLYEVKSSTSSGDSEDSSRKTKDYVIDIAFQKNVLLDLDIEIGNTLLIRLNKEYVKEGDINIHELFLIEDLSQEVNEKLLEIKENMEFSYAFLSQEKEPKGYCDCILKGRKSHCTTSKYSIDNLPDYPIHDITRIGNSKAKLTELVDSSILDIHDIPRDFFKEGSNYQLQIDVAQDNKPHIDHEGLETFLQQIKYPVIFLDYETYPAAIPRFDGYSPYQQIPFQFSVHIKRDPESDLEHYEFLHTKSDCPDKDFVANLKKYIPENGSIIVWNKTFECKIINERLMKRLPQEKEFLMDLNSRVIDLMVPFSGNKKANQDILYQHKDQRGSASIKAVLPIFAPDLSYKNLLIQEGGSAAESWNKITNGELGDSEKKKIEKALLEYCELDTLAMVKVWEELSKLVVL